MEVDPPVDPRGTGMVNVRDFGAAGDGKSDDTAAIGKAIGAAPQQGGVVFFPPGHYRSDVIVVPSHATFLGHAAWSYNCPGGTVISPLRDDQPCLFDAMGKKGTRWVGLTLEGLHLGREIHGIMSGRKDDEQNIIVDDCQIGGFSGSGIHLRNAHVWVLRHCIIKGNALDGIDASTSYDFWINDCQIASNGGAGLRGEVLASGTITGNRIEHNHRAGILVGPEYVDHLQITGNTFCSNHGPAIEISGEQALAVGGVMAMGIAVTGNQFRYSAREPQVESSRDCHVRLSNLCGVTMTGNTFITANVYNGNINRPSYGMILKALRDCVVAGNAMYQGATKQLVLDEGGHHNLVLKDNPGCLEKDGIPVRKKSP